MNPIKVTIMSVAGFVVAIIIIFALIFASGSYGRWNRLQSAHNNVKVSTIEIQNQTQRVLIAKQQADIRLQDAIGVREAQDEIAKTLTPLYVQYEMVQALQQIAVSGKNSSVVYLPSGAGGVPLVSTLDPTRVTTP